MLVKYFNNRRQQRQIRFALRWLKEKGLLKLYYARTMEYLSQKKYNRNIKELLTAIYKHDSDLSALIRCSFLFTETPEGEKYWYNVTQTYESDYRLKFYK